MDTLITSQEQLDQVKSNAKFNIKAYCGEYLAGDCQEVDFNNSSWYLYQYNSLKELQEEVENLLADLNLWDGGDDDFFDYQPDNLGILYQIFRIFQEQNKPGLINKYKNKVINALEDYFNARESGECDLDDWDELYEEYLDNFTSSTFPVSKDTLV